MGDILDNENSVAQRDPAGALGVAASQADQAIYEPTVISPDHDDRAITNILVTGMGGSALAALIAKVWLKHDLTVPFEVLRGYDLPAAVTSSTLVIASSYSGNTEETVSALHQANERGAQVGVISSGGALLDIASDTDTAHIVLPGGLQPRMAVIYNLRALVALLETFGVIANKNQEIAELHPFLRDEAAVWTQAVPTERNIAKRLAVHSVGKTAVFYGGALTAPLAYKWKISWNENAKNVAFWNEYPEFNHNEFMGWASHPVEKPFAVFDLISKLEHPQILRRFDISGKLLSGRRPAAVQIELRGDTLLAQLLWGAIMADFVSIYVAILNGVDPTPVELIEKLKKELG